jgi:FkbM family methyltransferase
MFLDPNDYLSYCIIENGVWEPETWRVVEQHLQSGTTFVDVGAHIGYYSLKAAWRAGSKGHVIAIEPNPDTVRKLQDNIRASGASNITVVPVACADSEATLDFFSSWPNNTGESSLYRARASQEGNSIIPVRVRARPLDAILKDLGISRVDVVKIDVEGAELLVLKGAQETLARYHPILIVELWGDLPKEMGANSAEITEFLRSHGYVARHADLDSENTEFVYPTAPP